MKQSFLLLDADYTEEKREIDGEEIDVSVVRLFGKAEDGKTVKAVDRNFRPYFYCVPQVDFERARERIENFEADGLKVKDAESVEKELRKEGKRTEALKVYTWNTSDVPKLRKKFKKMEEIGEGNCYEYSINFYKRYIIDKGLKPMEWVEVKGKGKKNTNFDLEIEVEDIEHIDNKGTELDTMAFDIESYEKGGEREIIMLSIAGTNFERVLTHGGDDYEDHVQVLDDERSLIERFVEIIKKRDPDVLVTYNGDEFDFPLLRERAEEYNIDLGLGRDGTKMEFIRRGRISSARMNGRVHVDLYDFVDNLLSRQLETEVLTLNAVTSEILGEENVDMGLEEILERWREKEDLGTLAEYCLKDSELTLKLADQLLSQIYEISRVTGQTPFDCTRMTYGQLVEWFILWNSYPERISPPRPKYREIQERKKQTPFKGGFVKEPKPGIHEDIIVLDFKSLYPTIIVSYNISPETWNCDCCSKESEIPDTENWYCDEEKGFIPSLLEGLIEERSDVKERMKKVEKETQRYENLDNRQYALKILSNSIYGYYGYAGARWYSRDCAQTITALGRRWIKEVMDMAEEEGFEVVYGDTDSLMIKDGNPNEFLEEVNSTLPGIMKLELEGKFKRGIFVSKEGGEAAKKRYALVGKDKKLKIRGFETVRRDWCALAKKVQRKVLEKVLVESDVNSATDYAKEVVERVKKRDVDLKDLIIYTQLKKKIDEYESVGPHVMAAKKLKEEGKPVGPGTVVMFVITEGSGSISERAMPFEFVELEDIDPEYYIDRQVVPAALRVLKVSGVDRKQLLGKGEQESLGEFTG